MATAGGSIFREGGAGGEAILSQNSGFSIIACISGNNDLEELATEFWVENREDHLHAAVKVAGHEIGAAEENKRISSVGK